MLVLCILVLGQREGGADAPKGDSGLRISIFNGYKFELKLSRTCPCYSIIKCNFVFQDTGAGLVAAATIAIVPGYISRSVAGSYDNEGKTTVFCLFDCGLLQ